MRVTLVGVLVGMAGVGAANDPPHPRANELQQLLVESCDWVTHISNWVGDTGLAMAGTSPDKCPENRSVPFSFLKP